MTVPTIQNPGNINRATGLTVTWTGGAANAVADIQVSGSVDSGFNNVATVDCQAPATAGTFSVPSWALMALPAGNFGNVQFQQLTLSQPVAIPGLVFGNFKTSGTPSLAGMPVK